VTVWVKYAKAGYLLCTHIKIYTCIDLNNKKLLGLSKRYYFTGGEELDEVSFFLVTAGRYRYSLMRQSKRLIVIYDAVVHAASI